MRSDWKKKQVEATMDTIKAESFCPVKDCPNRPGLPKDFDGVYQQANQCAGEAMCEAPQIQRRPEVTVESEFSALVRKELSKARGHYAYPPMNSIHEGYAVIKEELDELWDECRKKPSERMVADIVKELVQIAAMAQRAAEDLYLGVPPEGSSGR